MGYERDLTRSTFTWAEDGSIIITTALDRALQLARIINVAGKVIASKEQLFATRERWQRKFPEVTPLGWNLFECCRYDFPSISESFSEFRLNPLYHLLETHAEDMTQGEYKITAGMVAHCNEVVERIRKAANTGEVKRVRANMKRTLAKSSRRIEELLTGLRAAYSKVLVVRVDLVYRSTSLDSGLPQPNEVTLEQAQKDRDAFVDYLTKGPFHTVLAGYAWRLEYGTGGSGWHLHVAAFLDGQRVRKDIMIGNCLGRHWQDHITGGRGKVFNCNRKKEAYVRCGLGMFLRGNDEGWRYVRDDAMSYLEKADWYARFKAGPKVKLFDSGGPYRKPR